MSAPNYDVYLLVEILVCMSLPVWPGQLFTRQIRLFSKSNGGILIPETQYNQFYLI